MHKHTLTFEGVVPADEMERAKVWLDPKIQAARNALIDAFKDVGFPHTATSKTVKPKATNPTTRPAATGEQILRGPRVAAE